MSCYSRCCTARKLLILSESMKCVYKPYMTYDYNTTRGFPPSRWAVINRFRRKTSCKRKVRYWRTYQLETSRVQLWKWQLFINSRDSRFYWYISNQLIVEENNWVEVTHWEFLGKMKWEIWVLMTCLVMVTCALLQISSNPDRSDFWN